MISGSTLAYSADLITKQLVLHTYLAGLTIQDLQTIKAPRGIFCGELLLWIKGILFMSPTNAKNRWRKISNYSITRDSCLMKYWEPGCTEKVCTLLNSSAKAIVAAIYCEHVSLQVRPYSNSGCSPLSGLQHFFTYKILWKPIFVYS